SAYSRNIGPIAALVNMPPFQGSVIFCPFSHRGVAPAFVLLPLRGGYWVAGTRLPESRPGF
ncbi:MAG: hypothetical protein LAT55_11625, partial [Opitutales bacterium]|nr:hypothetical protein [Opitutales bacterium]